MASSPTLNETNDARNGEPMERPSRVFTAVCTGVIRPEKIPNGAVSIANIIALLVLPLRCPFIVLLPRTV